MKSDRTSFALTVACAGLFVFVTGCEGFPVSTERRAQDAPAPPLAPVTAVAEDESEPETNVGRIMDIEAEPDGGPAADGDPADGDAADGAGLSAVLDIRRPDPEPVPSVLDELETDDEAEVNRNLVIDNGAEDTNHEPEFVDLDPEEPRDQLPVTGVRRPIEGFTPPEPIDVAPESEPAPDVDPDAAVRVSGYLGWRNLDVGPLFVAGVEHDIATDTDRFVDPSESDQTLTGGGVSYSAPFKHARRYTPNWASDYVLRSGFSIDASYFRGDDSAAGAFRAALGTGFAQPLLSHDEVWGEGYGTNGANATYVRAQRMKQWDLGVRLNYDIDLDKAPNPLRANRERLSLRLGYQRTDISARQRVEGTFFDLTPGADPSYRSTTDLRLKEDRLTLTLEKDLGYDVRAFGRDIDLSVGAGVGLGYADTEADIGFDLGAAAPLGPSMFPVNQRLVVSEGRFFGEARLSGGAGILLTPRLRIELDTELRAHEFAAPQRRLTAENARYELDSEMGAETRATVRLTYQF